MALFLHNTLTRSRQRFEPADPGRVTMYVCGPTVYNYAHIGNARPYVVFDVLARLLRRDFPLTYARNVTDVDDKINDAAAAERAPIGVITARYLDAFHADLNVLGVAPPDIEPRVTQTIPQIIGLIERLVGAGFAYAAEGHVLFDVPKYADYGQLSGRDPGDMLAGARVEVAPYKKSPADFVLWKPSPPEIVGWDSPWGRGRPGWHIECSAMSWTHLGETIDIHGGGIDLVFPHHENEVAQSTCAHGGRRFARYWLHNGLVQVNGEKMSKSLGNFVIIREVLNDWPGDVARLAMLSSHYRQPINWTVKGLEEAEKALGSFYDAASAEADPRPAPDVLEALCDDLNTPQAIAAMHGLKNAAGRKALAGTLAFFGFRPNELREWRAKHAPEPSIPAMEIESRIAARNAARKSKNFAESDRIRDELAALGIVLKDSKDGTTWEVAR